MITKGQKISDRYEIIKNIGEGGMANVYLAFDGILNRKVAIKILRGDLATDDKFIRRFQREAIAASSLSHPNIVEMYDVGEDNGDYYIVMEYVEGRTLKQLLKRRGTLTMSEVIDIMLQVTDGIAHAHASYIIHRDLKPQNIMITDDGSIKITDFGIAMALNSTQLTQTNSVMGSVHYLPPEQATGKGSTIKSDIYSMGILFYELLTGKLPFKGDNAVEIALKHMKDEIPPLRKTNPEFPQTLENIILKSTAKNPKNRYADVKEMHEDFKTCLDDNKKSVPRYLYKYPEQEADEKDIKLDNLKDKEFVSDQVAKEIVEDTPKANALLWILGIVFLIGLSGLGYILYTTFKGTPNIKVPDVVNLTVEQAERALLNAGFKVENETKKVSDNGIEKGKVVRTEPTAGRLRPPGSSVTIYESTGKDDVYTIENYVGQNYNIVKTRLEEVYFMEVTIEKKDIEIEEGTDLNLIVEQSIKVGEVVTISKENPIKITLYVPDAYELYPDFVSEGWTVEEVEIFAEKYDLTLEIKYVVSSELPIGTITNQSRSGRIVKGASFSITVTKEPDDITGPPEEEEESP